MKGISYKWRALSCTTIGAIVSVIGGALMIANSTAIVADAFPKNELGKALGIITMVAFVKIEISTDQPMLDMRLLKTRILAFAYASNLFNGIARGAVTFLMVFYFQGIKAIDPIMAGILLTPFAASMFIVSPISGILSDMRGPAAKWEKDICEEPI